MGTNYYWHGQEPCSQCKREYEGTHIGKSSYGWTFTFHGTDDITSYKDWLKALNSGGYIIDEYGEEVSLTAFKTLVKTKAVPHNLNHTTEGIKKGWGRYCWLDEKGHSFSSGEFS